MKLILGSVALLILSVAAFVLLPNTSPWLVGLALLGSCVLLLVLRRLYFALPEVRFGFRLGSALRSVGYNLAVESKDRECFDLSRASLLTKFGEHRDLTHEELADLKQALRRKENPDPEMLFRYVGRDFFMMGLGSGAERHLRKRPDLRVEWERGWPEQQRRHRQQPDDHDLTW